MQSNKKVLMLCGLLWAALTAVVMVTRPVLPTSETRALTVAWEMLVRHDFTTMSLNFEAYSHKPPLLPWLVNAMWFLFGIGKAAATLVPAIATFAVAWMMSRLSRQLWPSDVVAYDTSLWIFFGLPFVLGYGHLVLYDFLLSLAVVACMSTMIAAAMSRRFIYFFLLGIGLGIGGLAKGPAILLHVLPAAILLPLWAPQRQNYWKWYGGILFAVIIGFAVALAWAIPAAIKGGPEYAHMIFFGQSTGRMVQSFDHAKPWWFYLSLLPLYILPCLFVPSLWHNKKDNAWQQRFLVCWTLPVFLAFSAISGKQVHYLFPLLPAFCLWMAARVSVNTNARSNFVTIPLIAYTLVGVIAMLAQWLLPLWKNSPSVLNSMIDLPPGFGLLIVASSAACFAWSGRYVRDIIPATTIAFIILVGVLHLAAKDRVFAQFDMQPIADEIRMAEKKNPKQEFAYIGTYEGDFGYLARMTRPIHQMERNSLPAWHAKHRDHKALGCLRENESIAAFKDWKAIKETKFRSNRICGIYEK